VDEVAFEVLVASSVHRTGARENTKIHQGKGHDSTQHFLAFQNIFPIVGAFLKVRR
jgi:hypothetical protein